VAPCERPPAHLLEPASAAAVLCDCRAPPLSRAAAAAATAGRRTTSCQQPARCRPHPSHAPC
jgi:hypothetical protein